MSSEREGGTGSASVSNQPSAGGWGSCWERCCCLSGPACVSCAPAAPPHMACPFLLGWGWEKCMVQAPPWSQALQQYRLRIMTEKYARSQWPDAIFLGFLLNFSYCCALTDTTDPLSHTPNSMILIPKWLHHSKKEYGLQQHRWAVYW